MLSRPVLRVADAALKVVPAPVAVPLARAGARVYARVDADKRTVAERNMRRILGPAASEREVSRATARVFEWYARYWLDSLRLPHLSRDEVERGFTHEGLHHITDSLDSGVPPIVAMPHVGGWEWAAAWFTQVLGTPATAVAERLEPPELFEWFVEQRRAYGLDIVALGPGAAAELSAALAKGHVLALMCDRDVSGDGIEVDFFGEPVRLPGGPALLALRSGCPLIPAAVYFGDDGRCHGVVLDPLDTERRGRLREDVTRVTQDLARSTEELIRRAPEQWLMLQPTWPSDYDAVGREPAAGS